MNDRLKILRQLAEENRGKLTIHALANSNSPNGRSSDTLCGGYGDMASSGLWRDRMKDPLFHCCPECVSIWNELTDTERKLLQV